MPDQLARLNHDGSPWVEQRHDYYRVVVLKLSQHQNHLGTGAYCWIPPPESQTRWV